MRNEFDPEDAAPGPPPGRSRMLSRPATWLCFALAGLLLIYAGLALDAYRHHHGAGVGEAISSSNPGVLIATTGTAVVATGLLVALSLLAFQSADSPHAVVRRGVGVIIAWLTVVGAGVGSFTYVATAGITIGHEQHTLAPSAAAPTIAPPADVGGAPIATAIPGIPQRVTLSGRLTLDGAPLDARFLGATVTTADGLVAACQQGVVPVTNGRYEIGILAEAEVHGCGAPGARIMLWTWPNDRPLYTAVTARWPDGTRVVTFDASFSTAAPDGARPAWTEFGGLASHQNGEQLPGGTLIEAFVGDVRCGNASVRRGEFTGYILLVAGNDSVPGCLKDAEITFRIAGQPALQTAPNDLAFGANAHKLDLTVP